VRDVEVVGVVGGYGLYLGALERSHGVETAPPIAAGGRWGHTRRVPERGSLLFARPSSVLAPYLRQLIRFGPAPSPRRRRGC